jgi:hypothetical protein
LLGTGVRGGSLLLSAQAFGLLALGGGRFDLALVGLGAALGLVGRDLRLELAALAVGLGKLLLELGLGAVALRLAGALAGLDVGVPLGLLEPPLARELIVPRQLANRLLGLAGQFAEAAAGRSLLCLLCHVKAS